MKLSDNTIEVLKNFSTINQGLVVRPGNTLKTISAGRTIMAQAVIDEEFFQEFGIYDLNKTLSLLSMNKAAPEVAVDKESLVFTGLAGAAKIRQRFSPINLIFGHDKQDTSKMPQAFDIEVIITQEIQNWIFSAGAILKCPNIVIKSEAGSSAEICATDIKGHVVDDASVGLQGKWNGTPFQAVLKIENIKIVPGAYDVSISKAGITRWVHKSKNITYWIALETSQSKFA